MELEPKIFLISFVITVILGIFILPILQKLKVGQSEREDGPKSHLKKSGTPTMGGIIMAVSIIVLSIIVSVIKKEIAVKVIGLAICSIGFGIIGFIDDYKKVILKNTDGLKPKQKMLGLLIVSIVFVIFILGIGKIGTQVLIPFAKTFINIPTIIFVLFTIFVLLATTNAVNLTDGIDGLATTVSLIIVATLTVIAIVNDVLEVALIGAITCGACVGFLIFNLNKAKVFMGDTGSLLLGGVISCMAIYLKMPFVIVIIALVPVIETLSVILQVVYFKKTHGKRIFKMAPIHHHFELSGWKETKVVRIFSLATLILCAIGALSVL